MNILLHYPLVFFRRLLRVPLSQRLLPHVNRQELKELFYNLQENREKEMPSL